MEIFGIPIFLIILFIWVFASEYTKEKQKKKEETERIWSAITTGVDRDEVIRKLGKPHRVWKAGVAEIWGYGPNDSDGVIRFLNGKVMAYQKPV